MAYHDPSAPSKPQTLRGVIANACKTHDLGLGNLTVLSAQVDPYRLDTPAGHRDGEWLAHQFSRLYGPTRRAHWRGLHYAIVADGGVRKPGGSIFVNTDDDWSWLVNNAAKAARWLGYIPFDRITDNRNAAPIIHRKARVTPDAYLSIGLDVDIPDADDIEPTPIAAGFDVRQAYHFVIFGEKSSLEDVVLPIAQQYEADVYLPTGEISDTLIYQIAKDSAEDGRPMVMFTLSDCDPAGRQMPVSIGRKLQAFKDLFFSHLKFEVVPVALTPEQVKAERLPETPLKEGEKRASRWREAFGIDQTEIDALTTPAKADILRGIIRLLDPTLPGRVRRARDAWDEAAQKALKEQLDGDHLARIRAEAETRLEELREQIDTINEQLHLTTGAIKLPPIVVPEPEVDLDPDRQALVSFDDDWVAASRVLSEHKSYGKRKGGGE
jgi:arsenate reductase-like glutaredoxin family protein